MTPHSRELADRLEAIARGFRERADNRADALSSMHNLPGIRDVQMDEVAEFAEATAAAVAALWGRDFGSSPAAIPTEGQSTDSGSRRTE